MPNDKPYWFRAKRYGWGWGLPATWQGWVVLILWAAIVLAGLALLNHRHQTAPKLAFVLVMALVLVLICYWKGEPPKWRWGDRSE